MKISRSILYLAPACLAGALLTGCSAGSSGLAGPDMVLACSDHIFWGTVEETEPSADGLRVSFKVDDWVWPASGESTITLVADDPAEHVGAPEWNPSGRMLVVDGKDAPLSRSQGEPAERTASALEPAEAPSLACPENY